MERKRKFFSLCFLFCFVLVGTLANPLNKTAVFSYARQSRKDVCDLWAMAITIDCPNNQRHFFYFRFDLRKGDGFSLFQYALDIGMM